MPNFIGIPSIYTKLLEIRKSKVAEFKPSKHWNAAMKLRYYQVVGALHFILLERMVLGDSTGIGKTAQTLAAYAFLLERDPSLKLLIVAPKSALYQWLEELQKFTVGITGRVITSDAYGGKKGYEARKLQYESFKENMLVVNYAIVREEWDSIKAVLGSNYMMVMDEVVAVMNYKSDTHVACKQLADAATRVYGLSATIIKNGLEEVWGIYDVVVPGLFGKITRFRDQFCVQEMMRLNIGGKVRKIPKTVNYKNKDQFKTVLDPYFLIRRKEEVADELPKLVSKKVVLEMGPEQKQLYKKALLGVLYEEKIKQEFYEIAEVVRNAAAPDEKVMKRYAELKEKYDLFTTEDGRKRGKLAAITYCQMVSNGPALLKEAGDSSKEEEFVRLMKEELLGEKVILFTRFKSGIPFLEVKCETNHIKYTKITGDENDSERTQARASFQNDPSCKLIFITTAGSAAINLQAASVIIFYDTPWSYGDLVQVIGRAQRIGSERSSILLIHLLNKGTIDMRVMTRVSGKKDLSDEIIGDISKGALDFTAQDNGIFESLYSDLLSDAEGLK